MRINEVTSSKEQPDQSRNDSTAPVIYRVIPNDDDIDDVSYVDIIQKLIDNDRQNMNIRRKPQVQAHVKQILGTDFDNATFEHEYQEVISYNREHYK